MHFFNKWQGNHFDLVTVFLYRNLLPFINIFLTISCIGFLLFKKTGKHQFTFDKELGFLLLLAGLATFSNRAKLDMGFVFYMVMVLLFAIALSFLPLGNKDHVK